MVIRSIDNADTPKYSVFGVHELCINRHGSSLEFRSWNRAESSLWTILFFKTYERKYIIISSALLLGQKQKIDFNT